MRREIINPETHALARHAEAEVAFSSADDLAKRMPTIPDAQKRAAGRTILSGLHNWLALSEAAQFWECAAEKAKGLV